MLDLNNPLTRQKVLRERLDSGRSLVAVTIAQELGISTDTVRRDLIALEDQGLVRRVRGGAVPVNAPMLPYVSRAETPDPIIEILATAAIDLLPENGTVFLDAGTTLTEIASRIPVGFRGLVVTAAPSVALAALRAGAQVHMIGGALCPEGAMATGGDAEAAISRIPADLCILGACGLWPEFGLSAEDAGEAGVKRAMVRASTHVVVVTSAAKFKRKGRHRVATVDQIDTLVTNAPAETTKPFSDADVEVVHV